MTNHVEVIIPSYDRPDLLSRAVKSALNQTYKPFNIIVIDDNSPTPIAESLSERIRTDRRVRIHRHSDNKGANIARTTGINHASGDYLAFLDDDDEWHPDKLKTLVARIKQSDAKAVYNGVENIHVDDSVSRRTPTISGDVTADLLRGNFIGSFSNLLVEREAVATVGPPASDLPSWQDWDFYLRLSNHVKFQAVPKPLTIKYEHRGSQISDNYTAKRDESAPKLWNRHSDMADRLGLANVFRSTLDYELAMSAIQSHKFSAARRHLVSAIRQNPQNRAALLRFPFVLGGRYTWRVAQKAKRQITTAAV